MRKEFPYDPYEGMVFYDPETEKTLGGLLVMSG